MPRRSKRRSAARAATACTSRRYASNRLGKLRSGASTDEPVSLVLPPGGQAWLYFEVEAARVGRDRASATVAARGSEHSTNGVYEILPPDAPPADGARPTIHRTVEVWTGPRNAEEAQDVDAHGRPRWKWVPLRPTSACSQGGFSG